MYKTNYFFSGCIENLGVVPLFSLACFLLAPAFFAFKFLLHLVCVVFEAIFVSLTYLINYNSRAIYLSLILLLVKNFIPPTYAKNSVTNRNHVFKDIFLAKGEQTEIKTPKILSFSVGNPEVIKYKHRISKSTILVKAKSLGFSDIVIWHSKKRKVTYHIYVTSKREQLNSMDIARSLKRTQLTVNIHGRYIHVSGNINNLSDYTLYKHLKKEKNNFLIFNVTISKNLRNKIIAFVYEDLYSQGIENVSCNCIETQIMCTYEESKTGSPTLKPLESKYFVQFKNNMHFKLTKNFELRFKLLTIDNFETLVSSFGINKIEASLEELLSQKKLNLSINNIFLQKELTRLKLLAQPNVSVTLGSPFNLQLGGEIPYEHKNEESKTKEIEWKFAGLKVNGKVELKFNSYFLKFKTMFTVPENGKLTGPKSNSSLYLKLNTPHQLFEIRLDEIKKGSLSIPYLSRIPFLSALFQQKSTGYSNRVIFGYVILKEVINE